MYLLFCLGQINLIYLVLQVLILNLGKRLLYYLFSIFRSLTNCTVYHNLIVHGLCF